MENRCLDNFGDNICYYAPFAQYVGWRLLNETMLNGKNASPIYLSDLGYHLLIDDLAFQIRITLADERRFAACIPGHGDRSILLAFL